MVLPAYSLSLCLLEAARRCRLSTKNVLIVKLAAEHVVCSTIQLRVCVCASEPTCVSGRTGWQSFAVRQRPITTLTRVASVYRCRRWQHGQGECGSVCRDQQKPVGCQTPRSRGDKERAQRVRERAGKRVWTSIDWWELFIITFGRRRSLAVYYLFVCFFASLYLLLLCVCVCFCVFIVQWTMQWYCTHNLACNRSRTVQMAWQICTLNKILRAHEQVHLSECVCVCMGSAHISYRVVLHWPLIIAAEFC